MPFSDVFVFLITFLMSSFCLRRWSLLLHHSGRLYSQHRPRCRQALHLGRASSHFFRRNLQVKHPVPSVSVLCPGGIGHIPDRDRRCIFAAVFVGEALGAAALLVVGAMVDMVGPGIGILLANASITRDRQRTEVQANRRKWKERQKARPDTDGITRTAIAKPASSFASVRDNGGPVLQRRRSAFCQTPASNASDQRPSIRLCLGGLWQHQK